MIDESVAILPLWMFLSAALGFMIGDGHGDHYRHQKDLQETNSDLRDELEKARAGEEPLRRILKEQRGVINDIHRHVLAVQKGLQNRPS